MLQMEINIKPEMVENNVGFKLESLDEDITSYTLSEETITEYMLGNESYETTMKLDPKKISLSTSVAENTSSLELCGQVFASNFEKDSIEWQRCDKFIKIEEISIKEETDGTSNILVADTNYEQVCDLHDKIDLNQVMFNVIDHNVVEQAEEAVLNGKRLLLDMHSLTSGGKRIFEQSSSQKILDINSLNKLNNNIQASSVVNYTKNADIELLDVIRLSHLRTYNDENSRNSCNICPYTARYPSDLIRHVRIHNGEKPYQCGMCDGSFATKSNLNIHVKAHARNKQLLKCEFCGYSCVQKPSLVKHMGTHTNERPQENNATKTIRNKNTLKQFKCGLCGKCFFDNSRFNIHMRTHTGEKPFKCEICDRAFIRKGDLTSHLRSHTGQKCFKCNLCDYSTAYKSDLTVHMRCHTGEKPFKCEVCTYSTRARTHLTRHKRIHSSEKFVYCGICNFGTRNKATLKSHIKLHSGKKVIIA